MKTLYQATALFLLALCFCQPALAQTPDTAKVYRHQIGILASPLYENENFRSKMPVALGLIYRANYKENKAIRVAVAAAYERNTYLTTREEHPFPKDTIHEVKYFELSVGHEWSYPISKRLQLGYGIDLTGFYKINLLELDNILPRNDYRIVDILTSEFKTKSIALQPFVNVDFALSKRISLVAESKVNLGYSVQKWHSSGNNWNVGEAPDNRNIYYNSDEETSFTSTVKPLSSIQLNFKF